MSTVCHTKALFPLTLALSLGERESCLAVFGSLDDSGCNSRVENFAKAINRLRKVCGVRTTKRRRKVLPLPEGEGRGEGEARDLKVNARHCLRRARTIETNSKALVFNLYLAISALSTVHTTNTST